MPRKRDDPRALITKRRFNLIEGMANAADARAVDAQDLGFAAREFVLCGLPYKRVKEHVYERRNGHFRFQVTGHPEYGLPFGQDRLVPIWLATAFRAVGMPTDNTIRFRSASDILRAFGISPGGIELRTLKQRLMRVFGATYYAFDHRQGAQFDIADSYRLIRRIALWFSHRAQFNQHTLWQNTITLSEEFAADLRQAMVPVDLNSVRALRTRPAALDLYVWQAWRSYRLYKTKTQTRQRQLRIPLFGELGLLAQLGTAANSARKARQLVQRAHTAVRSVWPTCPNELDGDTLVIRPAAAIGLHAKLSLIGVSNPPRNLPPFAPLDVPDLDLFNDDED